MKPVHNQIALRNDFEFLPTLPRVDCLSSGAQNL